MGNNILNECFWNNLSGYRCSSANNQILIVQIMSKIIFLKYLSLVRPKIGFKIKNAQNLLKFDTLDISNMPISILMSKIFFIKYLPPVRPKIKGTQNLLKT